MIGGEERDVFSAGNTDPEFLVFALLLKVLLQAMAELTGVVAYDVVLTSAVAGPAAKHPNTNLVFADLIGSSGNFAFTDIKQEARKQCRLGEVAGGNNPLSKLPTWIRVQIQDGFPRRI